MLNTPNEWHNEEDNNYNNQYSEEEYADNSYAADGGYADEYDQDGYADGEEYEDEEYEDEEDGEEEEDDDGSDDGGNDGLKKKIILAAAIVGILLLLVGGLFGFKAMNAKKTQVAESQEVVLSPEESAVVTGEEGAEGGDEVSIDVEFDGGDAVANAGDETAMPQDTMPETSLEQADGGLAVPVAKTGDGGLASSHTQDELVTVAIGDVGRKNPFVPKHQPKPQVEVEDVEVPQVAGAPKVNFDVIEPPELAPENPDVIRLLHTKVTGILYDNIRPAAIINDGDDERFVKVGETMHGCQIVKITKDRVVIRVGNNVYRASIGQSLLAEALSEMGSTKVNRNSFKGSR